MGVKGGLGAISSNAGNAGNAGKGGMFGKEVLDVIDELQSKINLFQDIPELLFSDFTPKQEAQPAFNEDLFPEVKSVKRPENPAPLPEPTCESESDNDFY